MPTVKEQAEALRVGLLGGYVSPDEVTAWADEVIGAGGIPGPEIIEVSLGGSKPLIDLSQALAAVPGEASNDAVFDLVVRRMAVVVRQNSNTVPAVIQALYRMYREGKMPSERVEFKVIWLEDVYSLARDGIQGTQETVRDELLEFFSDWEQGTAI